MRVRDIMQAPIVSLDVNSTLRDAAFVFRHQQTQGASIVDSRGDLAGVFTHEELLQALANGASMSDTISCHAKPIFCTIRPDEDVSGIDWQGCNFLAVLDEDSVVGGMDTTTVIDSIYGAQHAERMPYQDFFHGLPAPMFLVDSHWTIGWHNVSADMLCSLDRTQLCGRTLANVLRDAGFEIEVDPVDQESIYMAWKESVRLLPMIWQVHADDSPFKFMVLLQNVQDQVIRSRELRDLRDLSKELHAIIDSSFDGFFITDGEGRALRINRAYERITGIRTDEVLGKTMGELVAAGYYNESVTLRVLQSKTTETIIQKIKNTKTIVVTGTPVMDHDGNIWRVVTNVRDVTELRNLQAELEHLSRLHTQYKKELDSLRRNVDHKPNIIIRSKRMKEVYAQATRLAKVDSTVLLLGDSGVGKEVVAALLHENSSRRDQPFVKVSCAAIPEHLLESELFGYTPGAFTGALRAGKEGLFEEADKGTIFLDEIGEMPLGLQAKMLRVLQDKTFARIGGSAPITVDVRIITATNRNLEEMVKQKLFRRDLYYRLNVVPVYIPPLRERQEAIFDFIYHFLGIFNQKHGLSKQIETDALDVLINTDWPGNVRQLENTVERLVVMAHGDLITKQDALRGIRGLDPSECPGFSSPTEGRSLRDILDETECNVLSRALQAHQSTRAMARALGIDQSTVVRKMKRHGLSTL
ncbi:MULTISPECIES: sigma 54-interacting transcriptional regulator [unclassified Pseudodesulfovibrio]|uniref:sigma 54-interacting transcriptional regulator n=1 Tax=unclassified Pseudodesulfovibrio TaxID=2661612 RepID=UPI000FEB9217|nr:MULTISPECIES: sigma 54-interacting transcriptional regulator [unclassified Pseudodesulfovibrio]MCJ2164704.1 sigma 54-interacting transcriptional regulator [Pseudodesulfovibrio sp. S3-i]RWU04106.1 PAS domain-containing protein [Pseudodesulfovibrio sp. S3]